MMTRMLIVLCSMISLSFYDNGNVSFKVPTTFDPESKAISLPCYPASFTGLTEITSDDQGSPVAKKTTAKPATKAKSATAKSTVAPITININVVPEMMQFTKTAFTVKAGQKVILDFENGDNMQHNLVLIKPGTTEKVGTAADELARDPKGALKHYVPQMPEVLQATKLLDPEGSSTLEFTAPALPGDYPYICTFPGHWRMMKGVMKVVK